MQFVAGEAKCTVQCPQCPTKSTLSPFWTKTGPSFRVANFKRHYDSHLIARNKSQNRPNIQKKSHKNKPTRGNENILRVRAGDFGRLKRFAEVTKLRSIVLSKTNMMLRSELNCVKKRMPLELLKNPIPKKKTNTALSTVAGDELEKENFVLQSKLGTALCEIHRLNGERKKLLDINLDLCGRIRVFCRLRPIFESDVGADKIDYNMMENGNLELGKI